jgi:CheY-like chemotaxis protein
MSGFELVKHVKDLRPEIKIIIMTAYELNKEETQIVTLLDAFLNKPFRSAELIEAVEKAAASPN